jgi:hypothetical protein
MRHMKIRNILLFFVALSLQGCSLLVDLAFFNNSSEKIEICNLNQREPSCQSIEAKTMSKVLLVGDRPAEAWRFSIDRRGEKAIYEFKFGPYPEHASEVYCEGVFQKRCEIPVQYESNGFLYWSGKSTKLPVSEFPNQPQGLPVEPSA